VPRLPGFAFMALTEWHSMVSPELPIATGWSESCRVGISPTEDRHLCTAHKDSRPLSLAPTPFSCPSCLVTSGRSAPRGEVAEHIDLVVVAGSCVDQDGAGRDEAPGRGYAT